MDRYEISNQHSGLTLGIYDGESEREALDVMAWDAGYASYAAMCVVSPVRDGEIIVTIKGLQ